MACRYTYQGKTYEAHEFDDVLRAMVPAEASKYMDGVRATPPAPFVTSSTGKGSTAHTLLSLKKTIIYAIEQGHSFISWTTGTQQKDRYKLSKEVDAVSWRVRGGNKNATVELKNGDHLTFHLDEKGFVQSIDGTGEKTYIGKHIGDVIGKDIAKKIANEEKGLLSGEGLDIGGEWADALYGDENGLDANGKPSLMTQAVKEVARQLGIELKVESIDLGVYHLENKQGGIYGEYSTRKEAETAAIKREKDIALGWQVKGGGQPGFTITDALRAKATSAGMPLFSKSAEPNATPQTTASAYDTRKGWNPDNTQPPAQPPRQSALGVTGTPGNNATWDAPEPSKLDNVIYELQNKHVDTKRVIEAINKNGQIKDSFDPYLQEELYHKRTAKRVSDFQTQEMKPLLVEMTQRGVDIAQMEEYLHARHAKEANAHIADINPTNSEMQDGGSGMTNQEADDYLNGLAPERKKILALLAGKVDAMIAKTRQTLVDYRIESGDTIQSWSDAYQHYVPLFREDVGSGPGTGQGFSVRGSSSKARTGSKRKVVDIIGNIAMQRERAVVRGEKNRVALALYGLAKTNPNSDFWTADKAPTQRVLDKATNTVVTQTDPLFKSRENVVVSRMVNPQTGKVEEHAVVFNERDERAMRMAAAMKNLDMDDLGHVLGLAAKGTRYFASINTQYNPIFGLMNVTRDIQGALVNLSSTPIAGHQKEVLQHTLSAMSGIYSDIRDHRKGVTPSSKWAALWEEMQNEGGTTGYSELFRTSEDRAKALQSEIKQISEGKIKHVGRAIFDWLSDYNETMENSVRLAAYKTAIDNGMSKPRAASLAKTLTVNFNRKGRMGSQAGALYAFFNASMQGTARMAEALKGPAGKKIILGGLTIGVMQAMALAMAGFDDDEPPEFVRERNLIIPLTPVSGKKTYLTIPMPLGLHIIPNIGRLATELVIGGFRHPGDKAIRLLGVLMDAFNPIGSATPLQTITPTLIDPIAALAENKDWTGKPIYREERNGMIPTPGFTRAKNTSSFYARWTAEAINTLSGGTKYQPGRASPTPDQIDYLIGQVTGGVGREAGKVEQAVESAYTGEDLPAYKRPLLGRLYGDAEEGASQAGRFYENLKRINSHEAEIKGRASHHEEYRSYITDNPESKLIGPANEAENIVHHLNKQKRMLIEKEAPSAQIKQIEAQITAKMTKFNDKVRALSAAATP